MTIAIDDTSDYTEIAERAAAEIVGSDEQTTAVFAGNDAIAVALIGALTRRGVRVPEDVSVVGFDDTPRCLEVDPHLTTVRVPKVELGSEMARFLFEKISNPESVSGARVVPTRLVIRGSVAAPKSWR
jgi:DNA-binding LacI/PurR family transcriptional regulator